jgi:hypothetical protein
VERKHVSRREDKEVNGRVSVIKVYYIHVKKKNFLHNASDRWLSAHIRV